MSTSHKSDHIYAQYPPNVRPRRGRLEIRQIYQRSPATCPTPALKNSACQPVPGDVGSELRVLLPKGHAASRARSDPCSLADLLHSCPPTKPSCYARSPWKKKTNA